RRRRSGDAPTRLGFASACLPQVRARTRRLPRSTFRACRASRHKWLMRFMEFGHVLRANEGGAPGLGQSSQSEMSSWCEAVPASCGGPALADESAHVGRDGLRHLWLLLQEFLTRLGPVEQNQLLQFPACEALTVDLGAD